MKNINKQNKKSKTKNIVLLVGGIVLFFYVLVWVLQFVWGINISLKDDMELRTNYFGLPENWLFSNYLTVFQKMKITIISEGGQTIYNMLDMFAFAILYALPRSFFATIIPCMVAYVTTKFDFRYNKAIDVLILVYMTLPIVGSQPSMIQITKGLGIYDTIPGMWVLQFTMLSSYYFVFKAACSSLPDSIIEAAKIDGAGNYAILFRIVLPLLKSGIVTIIMIMFVQNWNDYENAMMFLPSKPTIAYGLYKFNFETDNVLSSLPMKLCGSFLVMMPIAVFYGLFSNKLMGNISFGGVKE